MNQYKAVYRIFGDESGKVAKLKDAGIRHGRAARQAAEIARYTRARVFITQSSAAVPQPHEREYISPRFVTTM